MEKEMFDFELLIIRTDATANVSSQFQSPTQSHTLLNSIT